MLSAPAPNTRRPPRCSQDARNQNVRSYRRNHGAAESNRKKVSPSRSRKSGHQRTSFRVARTHVCDALLYQRTAKLPGRSFILLLPDRRSIAANGGTLVSRVAHVVPVAHLRKVVFDHPVTHHLTMDSHRQIPEACRRAKPVTLRPPPHDEREPVPQQACARKYRNRRKRQSQVILHYHLPGRSRRRSFVLRIGFPLHRNHLSQV